MVRSVVVRHRVGDHGAGAELADGAERRVGEFVVDGIDTTIPLFKALIAEPDIADGRYDIHWLENYLS